MMNDKVIKIMGYAVTAIGIGVSLLSDWIANKQMNTTIVEIVREELAKRT